MADRAIPSGAEHTGERKSQDVYERLRILEDALSRSPFARGRLLDTEETANAVPHRGLVFAAGVPRTLKHGLGRRVRGFFEVYLPDVPSVGVVNLYTGTLPSGIASDTHITVVPNNSGTCAIWVF